MRGIDIDYQSRIRMVPWLCLWLEADRAFLHPHKFKAINFFKFFVGLYEMCCIFCKDSDQIAMAVVRHRVVICVNLHGQRICSVKKVVVSGYIPVQTLIMRPPMHIFQLKLALSCLALSHTFSQRDRIYMHQAGLTCTQLEFCVWLLF